MTEPAMPEMRRPARRTRQWVGDVAIALAVTGVQLAATFANPAWGGRRGPAPSGDVYLLLAVAGLVLIVRRRFPVGVLAVSLAATLAVDQIGTGRLIWVAVIVAFINAELAGKRLAAAASLVIGYLATFWPPWRIGAPGRADVSLALGVAAWMLVLLAIAELIRSRAQRAAALRRSHEEQFRRRASEERMRIARDLHDVLAHNISVINVQANTALHLMDRQPDRAKEALTAIHAVSKQALAELRAVLGVLRDDEESAGGAPRAPSPGLAGLDDLLAAVRSAGLQVQLTVEGSQRVLPAGVDIAAHRIVQESLTNTTRHSAAESVMVRISYEPAGVTAEIEDSGPATPVAAVTEPAAAGATRIDRAPTASPAAWRGTTARGLVGGNGITGMAERVNELGGRFEAGPTGGGGFRVCAWLPAAEPPGASDQEAGS